jgi:hypothetical protein
MEQQPREEEAMQEFERALASRSLSVNAASLRFDISRPALTKMGMGKAVELEVVERFARGLGEDVNKWRRLYGYPPVEPPSALAAGLLALAERYGPEMLQRTQYSTGGLPELEEDAAAELIAEIEEAIKEELDRRRQRRDSP